MSVLTARNLAKRYNSRAVVNDVSLSVRSGEVVGLLGPNGAGKTTSFYMIIGLVMSDAGAIHLDAQDLTRFPMHAQGAPGSWLPASGTFHFSPPDRRGKYPRAYSKRSPVSNLPSRGKRLEELLEELHVGHLRRQPR